MGTALRPHATDRRHGSGVRFPLSPHEPGGRDCAQRQGCVRRLIEINDEALRGPLPVAQLRSARFETVDQHRPLVYGGNRIELLKNGEQYFPRLVAAIDSARQSIYIETYIFELDNVGEKVSDALAAAAQRGVAVHLLIDGFGSQTTADALIARLKPHGAKVIVFRRTRWWRLDRRLLRRLHRKVALFDDRVAFIGGINIIDDHHHPDPEPVRAVSASASTSRSRAKARWWPRSPLR